MYVCDDILHVFQEYFCRFLFTLCTFCSDDSDVFVRESFLRKVWDIS